MSVIGEVREVTRGSGAVLTALWSGSVVLGSKLCGCVPYALAWAWDQARIDTAATAAAQAKADRKARAKARAEKSAKRLGDNEDGDEEPDDEESEVKARPVTPVRRPVSEALGMCAIGGILVTGTFGTVATLAGPYIQKLAPYGGMITTVGGAAWLVAAWMAAPPVESAEAGEQEVDGELEPEVDAEALEGELEGECATPEPSPSDLLAQHILGELATLELAGGKGGIHVTKLIATAEKARLLAPGLMDKAAMRQWLDASGLPVTKSVKVGGDVDYGVRVDRVTEALGMGPGEALARLLQGPAELPSQPPVEAPLTAAAAPAQAPPLTLVKPLPEAGAQGAAQEVA